jgi:hypothetical protein
MSAFSLDVIVGVEWPSLKSTHRVPAYETNALTLNLSTLRASLFSDRRWLAATAFAQS